MTLPSFSGYTVSRHLASGGMTDLYLAHDARKNRVVIRTPKPEYLKDKAMVKSFLHGGETLGNMEHPNIVKLVDLQKNRGQPFLVLEYLEVNNLRELIAGLDPMLREHPLTLIRQLASALNHVHRQGYIHMDIKPENIVVADSSHLYIIDFDLARPRKKKPERLRRLPGTPSYLAPETLALKQVDELSDMFSFGVTCYELLTLHRPFNRDTAEETIAAQTNPRVPPDPMSTYRDNVPPRVEAIILKCLAKAPEGRYPSMSLVARDLEELT